MSDLKQRLAAVASVLDLGGEGCTVCGALDKAPYTKEVTYTARTVEKTFKSTSWPEVAAWLKEHAPGQVSIQDVLRFDVRYLCFSCVSLKRVGGTGE